MTMMKVPLSKTGETTDSRTDRKGRSRGPLSATIALTQVPEATQTGMSNTVSTVKSRIIPKKSAGKNLRK
jgi:hypothetical protein